MKNLLPDLIIYEVRTFEYDEKDLDELGEEIDCTYVVCPSPLIPESIVELSEFETAGLKVEIYEARSATLQYYKGNLDIDDVDTSTGYNGSPIWEHYYPT